MRYNFNNPPSHDFFSDINYQNDILSAALLDDNTKDIRRQLHIIFDRLLRFCDTQQRVITTALELATIKELREQSVYERTQKGICVEICIHTYIYITIQFFFLSS